MKILKTTIMAMAAVMATISFTACSNDNDAANEITTPKYENDAKKFDIKNDSELQSIELTASGNYVVMTKANNATTRANENMKYSALVTPWKAETRAGNYVSGNVTYGSYTKNEDGSYYLEGYGTIYISADGEGDVSITVKRGSTTKTIRASVVVNKIEGAMADKLCRTWNIVGYKMVLKYKDQELLNVEGKFLSDLYKNFSAKWKHSGYWDGEDMGEEPSDEELTEIDNLSPLSVVFSKCGTYVVLYKNKMIGVAHWNWKSEVNFIFHYSWDNNFAADVVGDAKLEFSDDNKLYIIESLERISNDMSSGIYTYTILEEAK